MSWDAIGAVGEILGALAVLLTLIYLARQIRQSNAHARRHEWNVTQEQIARVRMAIAQDEEVAALLLRGSEKYVALSPTQRVRFNMLMSEFFWSWAQLWDRVRVGVMDREVWEPIKAIIETQLGYDGVAEWWRANKLQYPMHFREEIDAQASGHARRGT